MSGGRCVKLSRLACVEFENPRRPLHRFRTRAAHVWSTCKVCIAQWVDLRDRVGCQARYWGIPGTHACAFTEFQFFHTKRVHSLRGRNTRRAEGRRSHRTSATLNTLIRKPLSCARYSHEYLMIVGCDEAGCGSLMGDLVAAAVGCTGKMTLSVRDSKTLSAKRRADLARSIRAEYCIGIGTVTAAEIDQFGMGEARRLVFDRALDDFAHRNPDVTVAHVLVDGTIYRPWREVPFTLEPRADAKYDQVSAASILAKTERDERVCSLQGYDAYGWRRNKGYPTADHRDAIRAHGPTVHHRMSFRLLPEE